MSVDREAVKAQDCEGCGEQIGMKDFVLCNDGFTNRHVIFHKGCIPKNDVSDVQKNFGTHLNPGHLGLVSKDLG